MNEIVWKWVVRNTRDYGKADPKAVVGKVIGEWPEAREDLPRTMQLITAAVETAAKLSKEQLDKELSAFVFEQRKEKARHIELQGAQQGNVVTRFAPEPNAYMHIGHAKSAFLSYEGAHGYGGKCLLRFDDTNPEKESAEFVEAIREGLEWLGIEFDGEGYASDKMPIYYSYAEQLIEQGDAYVCKCQKEEMSANRSRKKGCECRNRPKSENKELWLEMVAKKMDEGAATLRLKGDLHSQNTVMRDPTLARILLAPHYRHGTKYAVWPTYDFQCAIADSVEGVTHVLRSKEYELRDELFYTILDRLRMRTPRVYDFSRLEIKGTVLSKRLIKPLIDQKKVSGWDDPRLPTLFGLRRRGILPQAIKEFVLSFGLSKVESEPSWEALLVENKKILDPIAERYFFVKDPVKLVVAKPTNEVASVPKHPSVKMGDREIATGSDFWIAKTDADALKDGETFRLKGLYNVKITAKEDGLVCGEFANKALIQGSKKIQWVPAIDKWFVPCEIIVPGDLIVNEKFNPNSLETDKGYCEKACTYLEEGIVIQFERYGFVRLDDAKKMAFIYSC